MITCAKIAFTTYTRAKQTADRMRRKREEILQPYRCKSCGKFHVGHPAVERIPVRVRHRLGRMARAVGDREGAEAGER